MTSRDPLAIVLRMRRVTVDDAKRSLAAAMALEEAARHRADDAEALIGQEGEAAADILQGDATVEAFAAWLPGARMRSDAARQACEAAGAEVARQRAVVTAARAQAEAASALLDRRRMEHATAAGRREQAALDEMAARSGADREK